MNGPPVFDIEVENFAIVTYSVPADRVQARLPDRYELDTFQTARGRRAFVSTTCFCNRDFRIAGIGQPRHTFNESTYRTYVTHKGRKGVYFFGRYLGTRLAYSSQRPLARETFPASFEIATQRNGNGYESYMCRVTSRKGESIFQLNASSPPEAKEPFPTGDDLAQFITYRLHGFYTTSVGGQGHMPVEHPRMYPMSGSLTEATFDLWDELGILSSEEAADPYSVLVVPQVPFRLFAPRPLI